MGQTKCATLGEIASYFLSTVTLHAVFYSPKPKLTAAWSGDRAGMLHAGRMGRTSLGAARLGQQGRDKQRTSRGTARLRG
jgi:hypothetical protein